MHRPLVDLGFAWAQLCAISASKRRPKLFAAAAAESPILYLPPAPRLPPFRALASPAISFRTLAPSPSYLIGKVHLLYSSVSASNGSFILTRLFLTSEYALCPRLCLASTTKSGLQRLNKFCASELTITTFGNFRWSFLNLRILARRECPLIKRI
ncbi:hypothetical protein GOP47_0017496 [Adiantum capillus-veneris]|uniref:Uncharacterized protein n=1 Tax=Adiantum capillus-veneris TaxID=13818 RepID=A0A9D4Z982_ADICA|nr:hypothetical protein GOP47_0017496 [Adiantum capillus-veneris]